MIILVCIGLIIEDCKFIIKDLVNCSVSFVRRSVNNIAHLLARASSSLSRFHHWDSVPPVVILDALASDLI